jgi:nucleotide-binding universal stress UspA family protein
VVTEEVTMNLLGDAAVFPDGYRRVLVALDDSDASDGVVQELVRHAAGTILDLLVVQVLPEWYMRVREVTAKGALLHLAARLSSDVVRITVDVRRGDPVAQTLAAADNHQADVIVMTCYPSGALERLFGAGVLESVRRESPVPVLLVPGPGMASTGQLVLRSHRHST